MSNMHTIVKGDLADDEYKLESLMEKQVIIHTFCFLSLYCSALASSSSCIFRRDASRASWRLTTEVASGRTKYHVYHVTDVREKVIFISTKRTVHIFRGGSAWWLVGSPLPKLLDEQEDAHTDEQKVPAILCEKGSHCGHAYDAIQLHYDT